MVARGALGSPKARGGHGGCRGCGGRREAFLLTLAAPCIVALFIGSLASCVQLAAADAEEYPEYHRPTKSEAAPHKVSQPDPESEDAFVDSMLDDIRDLESERQRWFREREEAKRLQQEQQEQQEQKLQAELAELATLAGQQQQQAKQAEQNTLAAQQQQQQAEQGSSAKQQQKQADEHAALVQLQQQQQQQAERSALARQQQNQPNAKQQEKKTEQSVLARQLKQQADQTAIVKQQQQASQQSALAMQQQNKEAEQAALARQQPQEADLTAFAYDDAPAYVAALLGEHKPLAKQQQQQQAEKAALNRQQQQQAEQAALARQQKETERAALARQQQQLADQDAFARQQQQQLAEQNALARQQQLAKQNAFARQQQQQQQLAEQNAFARQQQQQLAEQRPFARLLVGNPAAADAVVTDLERIEQEDGLDGLDSLDIDSDLEDLTRALKQEPQVPPLDAALLRAYLLERPLPPRSLERLMSSLPSLMGSFASSSQRQMEMQRQAQQQQRDQDRYQQQLFEQQHEQLSKDMRAKMLAGMEEPAGQQPPFTYSFATPKGSSPFASSPADTKYYQQDVRLTGLLSPQGVVQPPQDEQDEDAGAGLGGARGASSEQHDLADDQQDGDEDLGTVDSDDFPHYLTDPEAIALRQQQQLQQQQRLRQQQQLQLQQQRLQQQQHGVTAPVSPDQQPAHQAKPSLTRDSKLDDDRSTNLSSHEYPVVKKQLTFPKDHWFFGMDDVGKLAIFIGCSIAVSSLILGFIVWQYRLHRNAKAAADVEYPAYGVTGPNKDISPTGPPGPPGDRRLAQSAQMYHYQHQKQQILAMESRASGGRRGSMSEAESEDENEEGDYTVYECPGLAPTQEMEVKNPLFHDDPTPATPAPGEASQDSDGLSVESGGTKRTSVDGGRFDGKPSKQPANSSSRSSGRP